MNSYPGFDDEDDLLDLTGDAADADAPQKPVDTIAGPGTVRDQVKAKIAQVRNPMLEDQSAYAPDSEAEQRAADSRLMAGMGRAINMVAAGTGYKPDNSGYESMEKDAEKTLDRAALVKRAIADRARAAQERKDQREFISGENDKKIEAMKAALGARIKAQTDAKAPTEAQLNANGFANRVEQSEKVFSDLVSEGFDPTSFSVAAQRKLPDDMNALKSSQLQRQEQAERNFINAVLRRESGASISPTEFDSAEKQYFPRSGDSKDVLAQKAENRRIVLEALKNSAGKALKPMSASAPMRSSSEVANDMVSVIDPNGKKGKVPRSKLDAAKKRGFKVAQ